VSITFDDIEKLQEIECKKIIVGGAALIFYDVERGTFDIDIQIDVSTQKEFNAIQDFLDENNIEADLTTNFEDWGQVPLPEGFNERLILTEINNLYVLNPVDYIFSKLRRGSIQDVKDCVDVFKTQNVQLEELILAKEAIELPLDPISNTFNKIFDVFIEDYIKKNVQTVRLGFSI